MYVVQPDISYRQGLKRPKRPKGPAKSAQDCLIWYGIKERANESSNLSWCYNYKFNIIFILKLLKPIDIREYIDC